MFKRLLVTLGILAGLLSPVYAAGTIPGISMTQQLDASANPLSGGLLYLIAAGTTSTPQNCYQDTDLTLAWPNPITLDASGRVPQLLCADGSIKIRLTDRNGVQQLVQDNILIIGASSGSGGGGTVDATTILATGDIKTRYGVGSLSGFVRLNGRTIGSATSGATERANADTQALFEYLWGADENLTVSTGRGASAAADWTANKTITLPDFRGRAIAGLDTMGGSTAGRISWSDAGVLGAAGGAESKTLATTNLPPYTPSGSVSTSTSGTFPVQGVGGTQVLIAARFGSNDTSVVQIPITVSSSSTFTGAAASGRNSTAFDIVQPTILVTMYIKL